MDTPILDFLRRYEQADMARFHMPGHKGKPFLGCEGLDLTEVKGADALYEAEGIIAQSEANAAGLFGSGATFYSTEGSSQCIKAMLCLALTCRPEGAAPVIVAARNVHKAFVHATALLDFEIVWLWPEESTSLCGCPVTAEGLERTLSGLSASPAAVYITSPDYLGGMADISALAEVCHRHGTILAVDNAHGAYLHFLPKSMHPMDLGADMCCDSAHKTLPALTGAAYLHLSEGLPEAVHARAKSALEMFGSTSPSYLILQSLDAVNLYLADHYREKLAALTEALCGLRALLEKEGWCFCGDEAMKLTFLAKKYGYTGTELADLLRNKGIECEFADPDYVVLMLSAETDEKTLAHLEQTLCQIPMQPPITGMLSRNTKIKKKRISAITP